MTKWEFNNNVTDIFPDMLARSIPQYTLMRETVYNLGCTFVQPNTTIVDIGCSRGDSLFPFAETYKNLCIGIEISEPMFLVASQRFSDYSHVSIQLQDLRQYYPNVMSSLTLSILTLQFIPIEYRQTILKRIFNTTTKNGALILVEKVLGDDSEINDLMINQYYDLKRHNGYTNDEIQRKKLMLEGVLVPVTAKWNEDLLKRSGFTHVDCFWRWMNFAGWVAIKS